MAEARVMSDTNTEHERGLIARRAIDMETVRGMNFIPKTRESWHDCMLIYTTTYKLFVRNLHVSSSTSVILLFLLQISMN